MNKLAIQFVVVLVFIALTMVVYDSSDASQQTSTPAAQATATKPIIVDAEHKVAHQESESASTHRAADEDHTMPEAMHEGHAVAGPMSSDHSVPAEAAAVENPTSASDESISSGEAIYSQNCAVCHGDSGKGDGPGAATLNPKPADLHADHVQGNSDGAMFWIISHGREGTVMPAWNTLLSDEQRWGVVNFLRTFQEE